MCRRDRSAVTQLGNVRTIRNCSPCLIPISLYPNSDLRPSTARAARWLRMISALWMKHFVVDAWRRLPIRGRCVGKIGVPMSNTWALIRTYSKYHTQHKSDASQDLQPSDEQGSMDTDNRSRVAQSLALSWPLARQSLWSATKTRQRY
jgi:hypothetical protein